MTDIDSLPLQFRAVLIARHDNHLSYPEIAAKLGIPVGTAKSRLHRARKRLASLAAARVNRERVATMLREMAP